MRSITAAEFASMMECSVRRLSEMLQDGQLPKPLNPGKRLQTLRWGSPAVEEFLKGTYKGAMAEPMRAPKAPKQARTKVATVMDDRMVDMLQQAFAARGMLVRKDGTPVTPDQQAMVAALEEVNRLASTIRNIVWTFCDPAKFERADV